MMTAKKTPLLMVAPEWPALDSGYSLALRCGLQLYARHFSRITYLAATREPCAPAVLREFPEVNFLECRRPTISRGWRFARSALKRTPAILEDYPKRRIFQLADEAVRTLRSAHGVAPLVIAEDVLLGWLLACRWPGRNQAGRLAIRSHNVLGELFEDFGAEGSLARSWAWRHEIRRIKTLESQALKAADTIWAITDDDQEKYRARYGIQPTGTVDFGVNLPPVAPAPATPAPNVLYLGSADLRKGHGLHQFLLQAWPQVRAAVAGCRLILGGRGTEHFSNPDQGIVGLGFVANERDFYAQGRVLINPQLRGSGIKIKNIMGMFAGRAVVTTPKGAEGIRARAGEDFALAPTMGDMARKISELLLNPPAAETMGRAARARAMEEYSLESFFERCDGVVVRYRDAVRTASAQSASSAR